MNNKKKILFLVTQSEFGGAQRFIYTIVNALDFNKYDVIIAAGPDGDDKNGLLSLLEGKGINTRHLRYLRRSINPFFDFYLGLREAYKLIKQENPDILFLCSSKAGAVGSLAGRLAGIKRIIYRIGGWTFNDPWPRWKKKFYIKLEKWTAKFKDVIINNSEVDCKQAEELGIKPKEKILTIYNGLDFSKMNFLSREEARNLLSIQGTNLTVGGIINFYPVKGMKYLVEAAAFLINDYPELMFVIIGEGEERKKIENLIKKFNLKKNFYLTGTVSEAYKYLKMFDIFVLPSLKEGLPWTILESMAAEVPVVATKVGGVPEMIENGKTGFLVAPESAKELAEVIKKLLGDSDLREKIAEEAIKTLKEKFSLEQMLKQYEDLFFIN